MVGSGKSIGYTILSKEGWGPYLKRSERVGSLLWGSYADN